MINKERIEKAIENINGLILDFTDALDSLRETRELLYEILETDNTFISETVDGVKTRVRGIV